MRSQPGETLGEKLDSFVHSQNPAEVLERTVFATRANLQRTINHLRTPYLAEPRTPQEDARFIQKILWKLGFPRFMFQSPLQDFYDNCLKTQAAAVTKYDSHAQWQTAVRSSGVNLFVGLEELLQMAVAFSEGVPLLVRG